MAMAMVIIMIQIINNESQNENENNDDNYDDDDDDNGLLQYIHEEAFRQKTSYSKTKSQWYDTKKDNCRSTNLYLFTMESLLYWLI